MLLQFDLSRIFLVLVINLLIGIVFLIFAIKILHFKRGRLNLTFSGFYLSTAIGLMINAAYAFINEAIKNTGVAQLLNYFANFFAFYGVIFMLATNFILLKSEAVYSIKSELKLILGYALVLGLMGIFYLVGNNFGVKIDSSTLWRPVWSLPFFLYVAIVVTVFAVIPVIITSIKIARKMKEKKIKRRWLNLMIGLFGLFIYLYGAFLNNYLNNSAVRTIFSLYAITVILWVWLIYRGMKRE